jgi:hypothetical protein
MDNLLLSQTLAGNWVVTVANPEEDGWETQLAEFATTATTEGSLARLALEIAAANATVSLLMAFPNARLRVTSHDTEASDRLRLYVAEAGIPAARME